MIKEVIQQIEASDAKLIHLVGQSMTGKTSTAIEAGWPMHDPKIALLGAETTDGHGVSLEDIMRDARRDGPIFAIDEAHMVENLSKVIEVCAKREARLAVISQVDLYLPKPYLEVHFKRGQEPVFTFIK
jgi:hypothetical protein